MSRAIWSRMNPLLKWFNSLLAEGGEPQTASAGHRKTSALFIPCVKERSRVWPFEWVSTVTTHVRLQDSIQRLAVDFKVSKDQQRIGSLLKEGHKFCNFICEGGDLPGESRTCCLAFHAGLLALQDNPPLRMDTFAWELWQRKLLFTFLLLRLIRPGLCF